MFWFDCRIAMTKVGWLYNVLQVYLSSPKGSRAILYWWGLLVCLPGSCLFIIP